MRWKGLAASCLGAAVACGCGVGFEREAVHAVGKADGDGLDRALNETLRPWADDDHWVVQRCSLLAPDLGQAPDERRSVKELSFEGWERFLRCRVRADVPVGVVRVLVETGGSFEPVLRVAQHNAYGKPVWVVPGRVPSDEKEQERYAVNLVVWPDHRAPGGFFDIDVTTAEVARALPRDADVRVGPGPRFTISLAQVPGARSSGPFELAVDGETRWVDSSPPGDSEDDEHRLLVYDDEVVLRFDFEESLLVSRVRWQVAVGSGEGNSRYHREHHLPYLQCSDGQREPLAGLMNERAAYNWAVGHVADALELAIHNQLAPWEQGVPPTREIPFDGIEVVAVPVAALGHPSVDLRLAQGFKGRGDPGAGIGGSAP